jgi:hypothetical protein
MDLVAVGDSLKLSLQLHDGATGKFPIAHVVDQANAAVVGSPFTLTHQANGRYANAAFTVVSGNQRLYATFIIYNDVGLTTESLFHSRVQEVFDVETKVETVNAKIGTPVGTISSDIAAVQADTDDLQIKVAAVQADTDDIQAKIGTPVGTVSSDIASVQADTNDIQAKIGAPVSTVSADIAAVKAVDDAIKAKTDQLIFTSGRVDAVISTAQEDLIVDKVWDESQALHATAGTFGKRLDADMTTRESESDALTRANTNQSEHDTTQLAIAAVQADTDDIQVKIGTPVSTVSNDIASVKSDSTAIKAKTDQLIFTGGRVDAVISAAQEDAVVDKVWDESQALHATAGTFGKRLDADITTREAESDALARYTDINADVAAVKSDSTAIKAKTDQLIFTSGRVDAVISSLQEDAVVNKVWDEPLADHVAAGTMGANENLIDDIKGVVDNFTSADGNHSIVVPSLITLPNAGAETYRFYFRNLNLGVPANPDVGPDIQIETSAGGIILAYAAMTLESTGVYYYDYVVNSTDTEQQVIIKIRHKDNALDPYMYLFANSDVTKAAANSAAILAQTTAIKAKTDQLIFTGGRVDSVISTTQEDLIVDKVWDELQSGHVIAGSMGKRLDADVSTRESEASALSRASTNQSEHDTTQASLATAQGDITAIKAKTDQLVFTGGRVDSVISSAQEDTVVDKVWNELQSGHTTPGTFGKYLDVEVTSRESEASALSRASTSQSEHDATQAAIANVQADTDDIQVKIGLPVSTVSADIAAVKAVDDAIKAKTDQLVFTGGRVNAQLSATQEDAIVDKVWDEAQALHTTAGTFGKRLDADVSTRESEASASTRASTNQSEHDATQAAIASVQADTDDLQAKLGTPGTTVAAELSAIKFETATINAQTSQMTFLGGRVEAHLYTSQEDAIVDKVWDEILSAHMSVGSTGEALASTATFTPSSIANAVWDELVSAHTIAGTFGLFMDVIRQYGADTINELVSGTTGLEAIKASVLNAESSVTAEVNANETKIDAIIPAVNSARNTILASVSGVGVQVGNVDTHLTAVQAAVVAEVDQNEVKIDSLTTQMATIQNNTTTRFIVPESIYRPTVGSKTYEFHIRLYDTVGNPEAPDIAPTIRIRRLDTAIDIISGVSMTQMGANVGAYYYQFTVTSGTDLYQMLVEATVTEGGISRLVPATAEIVEFQSDLNAIQSDLAALDVKTTDVQSKVNNVTYGLSALHTDNLNTVNEINANEAKIDLIKAKTDNIPLSPSTSSEVAAVTTAVLTRPDLTAIITQLNLIRDSIKGIDGRSSTDVYNQFDISTVAKTNDPRFNNLDATVSSRSTLAAADVWAYATRTLSTVILPPSEVQKIWDTLTSSFLTANSVGKLLKDNLDAAISSRATSSQVTALLSGVAQESTVLTETAQIDSTLAAMSAVLTVINNLSVLIKAQTDTIPVNPASETTVLSETAQIDAAVAAINILVAAVKAKTDNLPLQPAQQGSVLAIPTNPALATDPRLNRLDVNVSTRSTLTTLDLATLASDTDLSSAVAVIMSAISTVLTDLTTANNAIVQRPTSAQMDTKLVPVAKTTDVTASQAAILAAIAGIPSGSGLTAAQVWAHAVRTLTASPTDTSLLAKTAELAPLAKVNYTNRISTVFNNISGDQEVIAWAEKDGQRVVGSNCIVTVKSDAGTVLWTSTLASPNADGVFKFVNPVTVGVDKNYYIVIDITVDAAVRTTHQPFFTVG